MANKAKILSDLSKIAVDAMSTFSGLKKEIETIVRLRVDKAVNRMHLVRREEFEVLKKMVQKLAIDSEKNNKIIPKKNLQKKNKKKIKKSLKK